MDFPNDTREKYNFLINNCPSNCQDILSECLQTSDVIRQDILLMERTVSLLPILSSPSYPNGVIPPRNDILKYIMCPKVLAPQDITPSFIQHASLFIAFIHGKPDLFAKVVVARYGTPDFHFVVFSVVPAFFGFFCTNEHITLSLPFFRNVIDIAPPQIAKVILQPFFCSVSSFRFIEAVMAPFCNKFGAETRFDEVNRQASLVPIFANELLNCIREAGTLLPAGVLELFKAMVKKNWSLAQLIEMFFTQFFDHQSIVWIASSPFSHRISVFQKILQGSISNVKMVREVFRYFTTVGSSFGVPDAYRVFDHPYIQLLVTVADIMCASRCYSTQNELPFTLRDVNYENYSIDVRFSPFWIRVFPKSMSIYNESSQQLIFISQDLIPLPNNQEYERLYRQLKEEFVNRGLFLYEILSNGYENNNRLLKSVYSTGITKNELFMKYILASSTNSLIERTKQFESMLAFTLHKRILIQWRDLVESRQRALMSPIAIKAAKRAIESSPNDIRSAFVHSSKIFKSNELKKLQFILIIEPSITNALNSNEHLFTKLKKEWDRLIITYHENLDTSDVSILPRASQYIFWESIEELRAMEKVFLTRQFELMLAFLKKLKLINVQKSQIDLLFKTAVVMARSSVIISDYLLFDCFIIKNQLFRPLVSDIIINQWEIFGDFLFKLVSNTPVIDIIKEINKVIAGFCPEISQICESDSTSSTWIFSNRSSDGNVSLQNNM